MHIPNSVKYIETLAFYNSGLTSIIIPNSVQELKAETFASCSNLLKVYIEGRNIMALDGLVIHSIVDELNNKLLGGKIDKVLMDFDFLLQIIFLLLFY